MVPEIATMIVLCSFWRLMPQRYEPFLPWTFPAPPGPEKVSLLNNRYDTRSL
jgi:hypothetical protein